MAIGTYAELKTAVSDWMARSDLTGNAADFIMLGEAHLNRELAAVETDATLTGTVDSRRISLSALSVESPIALFLTDPDNDDEIELTAKTDGTFVYLDTSGEPRYWALDGTNIDFDRPLDQAYTFRFRYRERFALSDSATTNWLLTNHPDVYLAATLVWGGVFTQNSEFGQTFGGILREAIPSIKKTIARNKRARLTVDPALQRVNRRNHYDGSF